MLNSTVNGKLLSTQPIAASCYPGPQQNADQCKSVDESWSDAVFQASDPIGLSYPINITCAPVNASSGQQPGTCTLGRQPLYAVNATTEADIVTAVQFAARNNVRVVIKETGHDILGRSEGASSLLIWTRYMRNGIEYLDSYQPSCAPTCNATAWTGAAISINGVHLVGCISSCQSEQQSRRRRWHTISLDYWRLDARRWPRPSIARIWSRC